MENFFSCKECDKQLIDKADLVKHNWKKHKIRAEQTILDYYYQGIKPKCICGCNQEVKYFASLKDFGTQIKGHIARVKNNFNTEKSINNSKATRAKMKETGALKGRDSKETTKKRSESHKGDKNWNYGKVKPPEVKAKIGAKTKERYKDPEYAAKLLTFHQSSEERKKRSERALKWMTNPKTFKPSGLEKEFAKYLDEWNIKYKQQQRINNKVFDFKIENTNIILEVDGDFWHTNPKFYPNGPLYPSQVKCIANDLKKDLILKEAGYKLIRIWQDDIKNDIEGVKERILKEINDI